MSKIKNPTEDLGVLKNGTLVKLKEGGYEGKFAINNEDDGIMLTFDKELKEMVQVYEIKPLDHIAFAKHFCNPEKVDLSKINGFILTVRPHLIEVVEQ